VNAEYFYPFEGFKGKKNEYKQKKYQQSFSNGIDFINYFPAFAKEI
jgi:hypothetical protein